MLDFWSNTLMNISTLFYFVNLGIFCGCITINVAYILTQTMNIMQDKPNKKDFKLHTKSTSFCGGIGILMAYIVVVLGGIEISQNIDSNKSLIFHIRDFYEYAGLHFYISCCVVLCAGLISDISRQRLKLVFFLQIFGFCIFYSLLLLLNIGHIFNVVFLFILSCLFLFLATNSINIIDGINGNATLCSIAILSSICYMSYQTQSNFIVFASGLLLGILLVFLVFNYPFGKMFLGDSGAFLLGFSIGSLLLLCVLYYGINIWYCTALLLYHMCAMLSNLVMQIIFLRNRKISQQIRWQTHNFHLHTMMWKYFSHATTLIINGVFMCFILFITCYYRDTMMIFLASLVFCVIYAICFIILYKKSKNLYYKA